MNKICIYLVLLAAAAQAGELYVVPPTQGKAEQDGSKRHPFTSIVQARDAIRKTKESGISEPWTVYLSKGVHPIPETIQFEPVDSGSADTPVIYRGKGKQTVLSGGIQINGWQKDDSGYWTANIPADASGTPLYFETLYVNDRRAVRSRFPDTGFLVPHDTVQRVHTNVATKIKYAQASIQAKESELDLLKNVSQAELKFAQIIVHHKWDTTRRIITGFDADNGTVMTQGGLWKPWNKWTTSSMYYLENVRSAFDQPGEWYYDGVNGKVLYRPLPNEKPENSSFTVARPGLICLIRFAGDIANTNFVKNISFIDMSMSYTDSPRREDQMKIAVFPEDFIGATDKPGPTQFEPQQAAARTEPAIFADGAHNITFENCELTHLGEYGIWFRSGCVSNRIQSCRIFDIGAGGIRIGATGSEGAKPPPAGVSTNTTGWCSSHNIIDNCVINRGGRFHAAGVAVWIGNSADNQVTHNDISDFFYTGVSIGWVWGYSGSFAQRNSVCYNRIYNIGQRALGDMGGVYTLGTSFGTKVCNNVIFDIDSYTYGGWGLYTDEGSEGILMENNLVYNTKDGSFHQHYGRNNIIRNNILCNSREYQVAASRKEKHCSFIFERNIIYWNKGPAFKPHTTEKSIVWRNNIWFMKSGSIDFEGKTFAEWQQSGCDENGREADPLFKNMEKNDFRLKTKSPALQLGFIEFEPSKAGLHTPHRKKSWFWQLF